MSRSFLKTRFFATLLLSSGLLNLALFNQASAELYRWTDANGQVHFSDRPQSSNAEAYHVRKANLMDGLSEEEVQAAQLIDLESRKTKPFKVYNVSIECKDGGVLGENRTRAKITANDLTSGKSSLGVDCK